LDLQVDRLLSRELQSLLVVCLDLIKQEFQLAWLAFQHRVPDVQLSVDQRREDLVRVLVSLVVLR
jgi:hypothetical protein